MTQDEAEIKLRLFTEFQLTDEQVAAVLKFDPEVIKRALDITRIFHKGDREYFKKMLLYYSNESIIKT